MARQSGDWVHPETDADAVETSRQRDQPLHSGARLSNQHRLFEDPVEEINCVQDCHPLTMKPSLGRYLDVEKSFLEAGDERRKQAGDGASVVAVTGYSLAGSQITREQTAFRCNDWKLWL